ncbi:MAG: PHP domain-containing protein [Eubacteriales bacterium]|nr:PHP domain-containing protein [Eubacteriales bacterium]MDY3332825.1 PHP domain-containing protein [Gallibacter sp.]
MFYNLMQSYTDKIKKCICEKYDSEVLKYKAIEDIYATIDLHHHTIHSDGLSNVQEIIAYMIERGITVGAITDHDGTGGVEEGLKLAQEKGIICFSGVEFSTRTKEDAEIHILGYEIDIDNPGIQKLCQKAMDGRTRKNEERLNIVLKKWPDLNEQVAKLRSSEYVGKPHIARMLLTEKKIETLQEAFEGILAGTPLLENPVIETSVEEACKIIIEAGGVPIWAHPGITKEFATRETPEFWKVCAEHMELFKSYGVRGVECLHKKHSINEALTLVDMALNKDLIITRGSDYHGRYYL